MTVVVDASAVLAWLQEEPGGARVTALLEGGIVSAANWCEVLQKVRQHGGDPEEVGLLLRSLGLEVVDVTRTDGERAAELWTREYPLSLGDRLCLAVAERLEVPVVTAESRWAAVDVGIEIQLIR